MIANACAPTGAFGRFLAAGTRNRRRPSRGVPMLRLKTLPLVLLAVVVGGAWIAMHPGNAIASPAAPGVVTTVFQPGGTPIRVTLWGDEFANGLETLDGYTVLQNPADQYWTYAMLDTSGGLKPSAERVGRDAPTAPRHLRPTDAAIDAERQARGAPALGEPYLQAPPPWAGTSTNVLMLMVQFSDVSFSYTRDALAGAMFGGSATGPGNLADYFSARVERDARARRDGRRPDHPLAHQGLLRHHVRRSEAARPRSRRPRRPDGRLLPLRQRPQRAG